MIDQKLLKMGEANAKVVKPLAEIISLKGKTAIVTGGTAGLGYAVSSRFGEAGANVVIIGRDPEKGENAEAELRARGFEVSYYSTDITSVENCQKAVKFTEEKYGKVDILVNNAAMWHFRSLVDVSEEDYDRVFDLNIKATFFMLQAVARSMINNRVPGKIVNVASVAHCGTDSPLGMLTTYNASKGAVVSFTRGAAKELKQFGINVNCIAPGQMKTLGNEEQEGFFDYFDKYDPDKLGEYLLSGLNNPMCNPDEVALMIFAASTAMADFMYGEVIEVSGGSKYQFQPLPLALTMDIPDDYKCPRPLNTGRLASAF